MIDAHQIDILISLIVFGILVFSIRKFKIIQKVIKAYEHRNLHEDIKLQAIQDKYYENKRQLESIQKDIEEMSLKISQLDQWFENEKESLERKENRLKQQKYTELYNKYRKTKIIEHIRQSLQEECIKSAQLLNQYAIEYVHKLESNSQ